MCSNATLIQHKHFAKWDSEEIIPCLSQIVNMASVMTTEKDALTAEPTSSKTAVLDTVESLLIE